MQVDYSKIRNESWVFHWSHDKALGAQAGCKDLQDYDKRKKSWFNACVVISKTSPDGKASSTFHTWYFGLGLKNPPITPKEIRGFIFTSVEKEVESAKETAVRIEL